MANPQYWKIPDVISCNLSGPSVGFYFDEDGVLKRDDGVPTCEERQAGA